MVDRPELQGLDVCPQKALEEKIAKLRAGPASTDQDLDDNVLNTELSEDEHYAMLKSFLGLMIMMSLFCILQQT